MPDISKWNTINIKLLEGLFYKCKSLKLLPDISKWNISNVFVLSILFYECSSLKELPDISKWTVNNVLALNFIFYRCSSLISLTDISKWNIFNYNINNYISFLESKKYFNKENIRIDFELCPLFNENNKNDLYLGYHKFQFPEINSKEEFKKVLSNSAYNMNSLFAECSSLKYLPNISN